MPKENMKKKKVHKTLLKDIFTIKNPYSHGAILKIKKITI